MQYGDWAKGVVVGGRLRHGAGVEHCPAPCLGYSFITRQPVWPELLDRVPVTFSLAVGAAVIWLVVGVAIGVLSALRRGSDLRPGRDGDRAGRRLAADLLHRSDRRWLLQLQARADRARRQLHPVHHEPGGVGVRPDAAVDHAGLAVLGAVRPAHPRRHARDDGRGLHPHRAGQGPARSGRVVVKHGLRGALTPILTIFGLDFGLLIGGAVLTERVFSLPGLGKYAIDAIVSNDLPKMLGVTLLAALFVVIANLVVDLLYAVVDPRVRLG